MKVLITDFRHPDPSVERAVLDEVGAEVIVGQCRTSADVIEAAAGCTALIVTYARIDDAVLAAHPEIRIVCRYGAGVDSVDLAAAARRGVWVANSPDYGIGEVATHALALALAQVRRVAWLDRDVHAGRFHFSSAGPIRRATSLTLGILGLGRIGKRMALVSREIFGRVIACDPYLIDGDFPHYVERVDLETLFARADLVSLHVPLTDETRGLVGQRLLERMKPGAMLVNTARGAVVDVPALLAALDAGRLESAALDVLPEEPPPAGAPVLAHPRVLLTPHAAFYSEASVIENRTKAARNIVDWVRSGRPTYVVVEGAPRRVS